jgi:predicted HTH transcriptional regulator
MSLEKPLEFITEADLQKLIADAVAERAVIEYKAQLPGNSDADKKEFLADVSSFANSFGGHLLYGMKEAAGLPTDLSGVEVPDTNSEKLRLENVIRTGLAPRIPGVQIRHARAI